MRKNIQTAIRITDGLIEAHLKNAKGMRNLVKSWNAGTKDLGLEIANVHEDVAKCLFAIKELLDEKPKCKHPKKMRDRCGKQLYCMQCNSDLDE